MALAITVIRVATMTVPKTGQPKPRTSSRERPKESIASLFSITIAGAITAQIVSRMQPGTISRKKPMPTAEAVEDAGADQRRRAPGRPS